MPTTSNFGWTTPADTDLVKDGAAAIRTLGNGIDTSFLDLKGGTTDQVLAKNSNTDLDFKWVAADDADAIQKSLIDAEGDLIVGDAADAVQRLAIGSNGNVLTVDTAVDGKIKWAAPSAGALRLIQRTSFSNVASQAFDDVFTSTYQAYFMVIEDIGAVTAADDLHLQLRYAGPTTQTSSYYGSAFRMDGVNTPTQDGTSNAAQVLISIEIADTTYQSHGQFYFYSVGNSSGDRPYFTGSFVSGYNPLGYVNWGGTNVARLYTGVLLKSSSTNITGTVAFYGLATA